MTIETERPQGAVEPERPQGTIRGMRFACWVTFRIRNTSYFLHYLLLYQCRRYTTYKISCVITAGYIWLHVSAVTRPSSGQQGIVLLMYIQLVECTLYMLCNDSTNTINS